MLVIPFVLGMIICPESPRWLYSKGEFKELKMSLLLIIFLQNVAEIDISQSLKTDLGYNLYCTISDLNFRKREIN